MLKLDYTLTSTEERSEYAHQLIAKIGEANLRPGALEIISDYIIFNMDKQEKKSKVITTNNRQSTIDKRELSLEGLTEKLENGEDGLYNLIANDKNIIFSPKIEITPKDLAEIEMLAQLRETIDFIAKRQYVGRDAYTVKKMLISLRQDQYIIKASYRKPISFSHILKGSTVFDWSERIEILPDGSIAYEGMTLLDKRVVGLLLANYSKLKQNSYEDLTSDLRFLLADLDTASSEALAAHPILSSIVLYKIDGRTNEDIQKLLLSKHGETHSLEYISSLWRNKIPRLIAEHCQNQYLIHYFTFVEKGKWKRCSRCGEIKLAHNRFFSKNSTSKDGWYSICKSCRNTRTIERNKKND